MLFNIARTASTIFILSVSTLYVSAAPVKVTVKTEPVVMSELAKRAPTATIITNCVHPGQVALTYDDGPSPYTQALVDYLNSKNVKATFFVNGNNNGRIEDHATAVHNAYMSGHQIGSHTYSHEDLNTLNNTGIAYQMSTLDNQIKNIIGVRPLFMRPPYGNADERVVSYLTSLGYYVTNWNIDSNDWRYGNDIEKAFSEYTTILSSATAKSRGYIALHHDTYQSTVQGLTPRVVDYLQTNGYQMVTVGHCLGLEPSQWYRA
ncbi:chitin deacetylase [Actinomortierella wolfii]|nr:chitin deacetylase [Actinomortierella wolfii]